MEHFDSVATLVEVPRLSIGLHNLTAEKFWNITEYLHFKHTYIRFWFMSFCKNEEVGQKFQFGKFD